MIPHTHWQKAYNRIIIQAFAISMALSVLIFVKTDDLPTLPRLIILLIVNGANYLWQRSRYHRHPNMLEKVFYIQMDDMLRFVESILKSKLLPFERILRGKTFHVLIDDGKLELIFSPYAPVRYGVQMVWENYGTCIQIRPVTPENHLLVDSLTQKIDNLLKQKGL